MDNTGRDEEDVRHEEGIVKETQNTLKKIAPTKPDFQIVKKTTPNVQDIVKYTKETEIMEVKYKKNIICLKA